VSILPRPIGYHFCRPARSSRNQLVTRRTNTPLVLLAAAIAVLASRGNAESATTITLPVDFSDELVASVASPTALAFTPDGRMLITTQPGQLRVYANGALIETPAIDLAAPGNFCSTSERGLLGVAVDPGFAANGYIYLYYSPRVSGECKNRLSRFTMTGNTVSLESQTILVDNIPAPFGTHNAGDVHVGKDGHLYVSVGDGGGDYADDSGSGAANDAARDMHALVGKILRLTREGGIPTDNPFQDPVTSVRCNTTGTTAAGKQCREIYATGVRNPFRIAFDPNAAGTRFFINDVGQNTWEEIDEGISGADYGWNVREGPCVTGSTSNCGAPPVGMTNPIFSYRQGDPSGCRAVTGGAFVPAGVWPAAYNGTYLFADYVCGRIFRLDRQQDGSYMRNDFATGLGSNSAVHLTFGPHDGTQALYYTTYDAGGSVRRIAHTGSTNRVPTASISASPISGPAPLEVSFDGSASTDPDTGDTLTYEWDFGDGQTASGSSSTVDHTYASAGTFTASLRVRDNRGALSPPAAVQIQPGNTAPAPVIQTPAAGDRFRVGETIVLQGSATDAQEGSLPASRLRWRVLRHHGTSHTHPWLQETEGNGIAVSTPGPEDLATSTTSFLEVILTATDSAGLSTTVTRELRPRLVELTFVTEPAGLTLQVNGEAITAPRTFSSWESWTFPASAARQQDSGGAWWVFDHWSDGGAATHNVTTGASPATYTATFRPNAAPVTTGASVSTPEDTARTIPLAAADADGDMISRAISRSPSTGSLGTISGANVIYAPAAQTNGADSFEFTATDGAATSAPATISITVTEVNDPPDGVDDTASAAEDGNVLVNVRANDAKGPANESSQMLTVSSVTMPLHGTAVVEGGSVRYTPAANYSGPDAFGYQVCDNGKTNGAPAPLCDTATVSVIVTAVNDAPVAVDDAAATSIGRAVTIDVLANDSKGPPDEAGQTLTVASIGTPAHGTAVLDAGKVRYTPTSGYLGPDSFSYQACDNGGLCDTGQVSISVELNTAPVASDVVASALEDVEAAIDLAGFDPEGGTLTFSVVTPPAHGTVAGIEGRVLRYLPAPNYHGDDSLSFRVSDGTLQSNVATVALTVHAVNDQPTLAPDVVRAESDAPILLHVLGNDSPGPADELTQTLRLANVGAPRHGTAAPTGDGRILYTPSPTYNGADAFVYTVCDDGRTGGLPDPRCAVGTVDFAFASTGVPHNLSAPRLVGGRRAGTVAVAQLGEWSLTPARVDYRWLRCAPNCTAIMRAAGARYRVRLGDVGQRLRVVVTVRNRFGETEAISPTTRPVGSPLEVAAVRHRRAEWVLLRNETSSRVALRGWRLRDARGAVQALRGTIGPRHLLRVPTRPIWNARDRVTLVLPDGHVADTCSYAARAAVARC
jgi:glucose/arabinose dehydrogenase